MIVAAKIAGVHGSQPSEVGEGDAQETINVDFENIGIPIIVCVTKVDCINQLEKDFDFKEEHWDFIQMHLRRFCLQCKFLLGIAY